MTTKKVTKKTDKPTTTVGTSLSCSNGKDVSWTRERSLELAVDIFKHPSFVKEANSYSIVSLADTFTTYILEGKDAAFPGANQVQPAAS